MVESEYQGVPSEEDEPGLAVTLFDLVKTFQQVLDRAKDRPTYEVGKEDVTVPDMIRFVRNLLESTPRSKALSVTEMFEQQRSRRAMICLFLALLELVKRQAVLLKQADAFGDISIQRSQRFSEAFAGRKLGRSGRRGIQIGMSENETSTPAPETPDQEANSEDPITEAAAVEEAAAEAMSAESIEQFIDESGDSKAEISPDAAELAILEAIVYITDEPLGLQQIANALGKPMEHVKGLLDRLVAEYNRPEHGLMVREVAGGYKMATKPEHHEARAGLRKEPESAVETVAARRSRRWR